MNPNRTVTARSSIYARGLAGFLALVSSALLVFLLGNLDRGLDLTDEAYYLLWLDKPAAYGLAASMFGHFLAPIYHLLGSDPAALRRFGLIAPVAAVMLMAWTVLRTEESKSKKKDVLAVASILLGTGSTIITYYMGWLTTPAYNWLPLPASFLLLTALVLVHGGKAFWLSVFLVGFSCIVAFAGKPTTLVGFVLVYGIGMLSLRGPTLATLRHVAVSAMCCLLLIVLASVTFLDAPLAIAQGRTYVEFFGVRPATGRFFQGAFGPPGYYVAFAAALASYWAPPMLSRICGLVAILASASVVFAWGHLNYNDSQGMIVMSASLALVANCLAWGPKRPDGRLLLILSLGHILPWVIAFGTSNLLARQTGCYVALPLTAAIITARLCFRTRDWQPLAAAMLAPVLAGVSLYSAESSPYRLRPNLSSHIYPVQVAGGTLRVDAETRDFITELRRHAAQAGFTRGTAILDFSGDIPGVALLLDGRAPYFPWMVGGYEFSERLAAAVVAQLSPEERQVAWLVRNDSPRPFSLEFMASLGFDLESGHTIVAEPLHPLYREPVRLYAPSGNTAGPRY